MGSQSEKSWLQAKGKECKIANFRQRMTLGDLNESNRSLLNLQSCTEPPTWFWETMRRNLMPRCLQKVRPQHLFIGTHWKQWWSYYAHIPLHVLQEIHTPFYMKLNNHLKNEVAKHEAFSNQHHRKGKRCSSTKKKKQKTPTHSLFFVFFSPVNEAKSQNREK